MEKTLENKAKFFAQYWGQEVVKWNFSTGESSYMTLPLDDFRINEVKKFHLILKPLLSIADEDAVDLSKIIKLKFSSVYNDEFVLSEIKKSIINDAHNLPYAVVDYLRSKSYALPYMGLSIEKLIEYGWVKINV